MTQIRVQKDWPASPPTRRGLLCRPIHAPDTTVFPLQREFDRVRGALHIARAVGSTNTVGYNRKDGLRGRSGTCRNPKSFGLRFREGAAKAE